MTTAHDSGRWWRALPAALLVVVGVYAGTQALVPDAAGRPVLIATLNAALVAAFLPLPSRRLLPLFLAAVAAIGFALWWLWPGASGVVAASFAVGAVGGLVLYRWVLDRSGGAEAFRMGDRRSVVAVLGAGVAAPLVSFAIVGVLLVVVAPLLGWATPLDDWLPLAAVRAAAQTSGMITVTPLLAMLLTGQIRRRDPALPELAAWGAAMAAAAVMVGLLPGLSPFLPGAVVLFAALIVAVLRHGRLAAAVLTPVLAVAAAAGGPVQPLVDGPALTAATAVGAQTYAVVVALSAWAVAVLATERQQALTSARDALTERVALGETRFAAAMNHLVDPVTMLAPQHGPDGAVHDFLIRYANDAARTAGVTAGVPVSGRHDVSPELLAAYCSSFTTGTPLSVDAHRVSTHHGTLTRYFDVRARRVGEELLATWRDATERVVGQRLIAAHAARFDAALAGMLDPLVMVRPVYDARGAAASQGRRAGAEDEIVDFVLTYVNDAAREWGDLVVGEPLLGRLEGPHRQQLVKEYATSFETRSPIVRDSVPIPDPSEVGENSRYVDLRASRVDDCLLVSWRDVTARKTEEDQLARQALFDQLTGLANRHQLDDRLTQALAELDRRPGTLAVLYLDLDGFKEVNDALGHDAGDQVLVEVGRRLSQTLRAPDTLARLAGDEFVALARVRDDVDAAAVAERMHAAVAKDLTVEGRTLAVRASIGVTTTHRPDADPGALLRAADLAMYQAKQGGTDWAVYDAALHESARQRQAVQQDLARALREHWLVLHYQPVVDLVTGEVVAAEALLRLEHPDRGLMMPDTFIDVAEDSDLIVQIGSWVLQAACAQLAAWQRHSAPPLRMAVNVSGRQLKAGGLSRVIDAATSAAGVNPARLTIEITERVLIEAGPGVLAELATITASGCGLAIDDFGTGYSSLSYLKQYPVTTVKIDKSFVAGLGTDPEDTAIVSAIVGLAQTLELDVVAEGVETLRQADLLRGLDCRHAQGFLFGRPTTADQVLPAS